MTVEEWAAGFSASINVAIMAALLAYFILRRNQFGTPAYCIGAGIFAIVFGEGMCNGWIWFYLLMHHEIDTSEKLEAMFPFVGSRYWLIGTLVTAVGLVKVIKEFSEAYLGNRYCSGAYCWYTVLVISALGPLISIWI